jgi:hypothetical protein
MSGRLTPCKRRDFIRKLRALGFEGPTPGKKHEVMVYEEYRLPIPSYEEFSVEKTNEMIKEVADLIGRKIRIQEWNRL